MTLYSATNFSVNTATSTGDAHQVYTAMASVDVPSTFSTSDSASLFYLPKGATVIGGLIKSTDLDSAGSPAVTLHVGIAGDTDKFFSGSTVGQAGTASAALAADGAFYTTTARKTLVSLIPAVNPGTGVAGTVQVVLQFLLP